VFHRKDSKDNLSIVISVALDEANSENRSDRPVKCPVAECNVSAQVLTEHDGGHYSGNLAETDKSSITCMVKCRESSLNVVNCDQKSHNSNVHNTGPKYYLKVQVNGTSHLALVDSGATISAISPTVANGLSDCSSARIPVEGMKTSSAFEGARKVINEAIEIDLTIAGKTRQWKFYIIDGLATNIILGSDWMEAEQVILDAAKKTITFGKGKGKEWIRFENYLNPVCKVDGGKKLRLREDMMFPAMSAIRTSIQSDDPKTTVAVLTPRDLQFVHGLAVPYVHSSLVDGITDIWVTNMLKHEVLLNKNTMV